MRRLDGGGSRSYLGNGSVADIDDQRVARRVSVANQISPTCGRFRAAAHLSAMAGVIGEKSAEVIVLRSDKYAGHTAFDDNSAVNTKSDGQTSIIGLIRITKGCRL